MPLKWVPILPQNGSYTASKWVLYCFRLGNILPQNGSYPASKWLVWGIKMVAMAGTHDNAPRQKDATGGQKLKWFWFCKRTRHPVTPWFFSDGGSKLMPWRGLFLNAVSWFCVQLCFFSYSNPPEPGHVSGHVAKKSKKIIWKCCPTNLVFWDVIFRFQFFHTSCHPCRHVFFRSSKIMPFQMMILCSIWLKTARASDIYAKSWPGIWKTASKKQSF